jgi:hypothetical protein
MRQPRRILLPLILILPVLAIFHVPAAAASSTQEAIFEDDAQLHQNLDGTLATIRSLGVTRIRLFVSWASIAPAPTSTKPPRGFRASNPGDYPAANWNFYDQVLEKAKADGVAVDFMLTAPAPRWAEGPGEPKGGLFGVWKPSGAAFGAFVKAVGTRYSGTYTPNGASVALPRVDFWAIWNEPNYGPDLAPQATDHDTVELSPAIYRSLLDHAWSALAASGHRHDTILFGETAPHGKVHPIGDFSGMYPLRFLRAVYCVDSRFHALRGQAASLRGCPTTAAGSRTFRAQNPALFSASAYAVHPYTESTPPNKPLDGNPDAADLAGVPRLERTLDRLNRVYGSRTRFAIYSTEYGYQTNPPETVAKITPATAATYLNWAEYISYKNPRIKSFAQYLLVDPSGGNFASGLEFADGRPKPAFAAYKLPLYLPTTSAKRGATFEVWGCARLAHLGGGRQVQIQFQNGSKGPFRTVNTVTVSGSRGYFDVRQAFPASGTVRLFYTDPSGRTLTSRSVTIRIH